jgi:hypothetical protein
MSSATHYSVPHKCVQLKLSIDTLEEFMLDGWCHNDEIPQNVLVTGSPGSHTVVFIDLSGVTRLTSEAIAIERHLRLRKLYVEIYDLLQDNTGDIQRWAATNIDMKISDPIQVYPMHNY